MHKKVYFAIRTYHSAPFAFQGRAASCEANSIHNKDNRYCHLLGVYFMGVLLAILDILFLIFTAITHGKYHGLCFIEKPTEAPEFA